MISYQMKGSTASQCFVFYIAEIPGVVLHNIEFQLIKSYDVQDYDVCLQS